MTYQSLILNFYPNIKKNETVFLKVKKTSKNNIICKINIFNRALGKYINRENIL